MTAVKPFGIRISAAGSFYVLVNCRRYIDKDGVNRVQGEYIKSYQTFKGVCNAIAIYHTKGYWPDFYPSRFA
ncbi:MAG TPA: hypothetical protein VKB96_05920 [Gammaproteobacteria bacterium]|nr:hypothetical protein [Gammaproteobacteria bacterium]